MKQDKDQIWNLLGKYISDEATAREKELVEEWKDRSKKNREIFEFIQKVWEQKSASDPFATFDLDEAWRETKDKLEKSTSDSGTFLTSRDEKKRKESKTNVFQLSKIAKYAAAAILLIVFSFSGFFLYQFQEDDFSGVVYKTQAGETQNFQLSDGSEVLLAPKTKLVLVDDFNSSSRSVRLEGEANFSVESHRNKPFRVHTQNSVTKVLGTKFNVMSLPGEGSLEVLVTEGTVAVEKRSRKTGDGDIILQKGDLLQTQEHLTEYELRSNVDTSPYLKWQQGVIYLDDLSFDKVSDRLERWYPIKIQLADEDLAEKKLTAEFHSSQSLKEVLDAVSLSLRVEYRWDQKNVIFYELN